MYDILSAIQESNTYLEDEERIHKNYPTSFCIKKALERNMEIVGLALNNILDYQPALTISSSGKIIDISERLANVDDPVSEEIMKVALFEYFPKLKDEIHLIIIQSS